MLCQVDMLSEPLRDLAASLRRALQAEGKAKNTIRIYTEGIDIYADWLQSRGLQATLGNLTRSLVREWMAELLQTRKPGTVATRYQALRRLARWCVAEEILERNPLEGISPPQPRPRPVRVLSDEQLKAILDTCKGRGFYNRRDEAILRLLSDCGLRAQELVDLKLSDVDLDEQVIAVRGKTGARHVYPSTKTVLALDRWLRERRRHRDAYEDALFLGQRGPITKATLRRICKVRGEQAGVGHVHPHMFRHTAASWWLQAGGAETDLKRIMGWSSSAMLQVYGRSAADARAREAARRLRPGDRV